MRRRTFTLAFLLAVALCVALIAPSLAARIGHAARLAAPPLNVDVSQRPTNESEETVAVNPTNPRNIVIVTNVVFPDAGLFEGVSFDGGATWATKIIADNDNLGAACCDPSLSFDSFGNLFLTYLFNVGNVVPIALSTDGGISFTPLASIAKPPKSSSQNTGERRGLFRFVDQPTARWWPRGRQSRGSARSARSSRQRWCPVATTARTGMSRSAQRGRSCRAARSPRAARAAVRSS